MENYIKKDKTILLFSYLFFVIPAILFLIGWFKLYISIPAVILLVIATFFCFKNFKVKAEDEYKSIFKIKKWIIVIVLVLILNILSGIGGFAFQNGDHNARNAVMHDLIDYKWVTGFIIFMSIIPFFYIGQGADFVNRVSIPMLIVIMFMIMEKINNFNFKKPIHLMIIIYLLISSVTAYNEITRTIYRTVMQNKFDINLNRNDNWLTYGKIIRDDVIVHFKNFSTPYDKERFIFKYILK
ncbi:MAG: hypothetical protein WDA12_01100 [Bacilli bacterium]